MVSRILFSLTLVSMFLMSCEEEEVAIDCATVTLKATISEVSNATCLERGSASFTVADGLEPYEYSINGTSFVSTNVFDNLKAGTYTLHVRDENQCTTQFDFDILEDEGISSVETQVLQSAEGCGGTSGSVLVTVSSPNEGEIQYNIDGGEYSNESQFDNLPNGDHTIRVLDAAGCEEESLVYVPSGISYETNVKSIIELNCTLANCHVAGTSRVDFTVFSNVQAQADLIMERTGNTSMPPSSSNKVLTDTEIDLIACWVNDGAPNN